MARAIDLELLQLLEDKLGKETARKVAQAIEIGLEILEKRAEELAIQKKLELKDELTKELASKADIQILKAEIQTVRAEMQAMEERLEAKIELVRRELDGKIEREGKGYDRCDPLGFAFVEQKPEGRAKRGAIYHGLRR